MNGVISTALSGLQAASTRVGAAANNIANVSSAGSTDPAGKKPYTPQDVIQTSTPNSGVKTTLRDRDPATVPAYAPNTSYADENGQVAAPNIDLAGEITSMTQAKHAYEASLKVIETAKELDDALNEIV